MSSSLIIYSTVDGHTKSICEHIKNNFKSDENIKIVSLDDMQDLNLSNFDKIISSIMLICLSRSSDLILTVGKLAPRDFPEKASLAACSEF